MEGSRVRSADPRAVDSVLRAVDFVEERMGDDIGVEDMAREACFSPFYFSRLFVEATGHAPYDYLMRRRVAAAAEEVVGSGRSLTEIALDRGFAVPDSFGRAFRRCFGLLPSEARRTGSYPRAIARTRIDRAYIAELLGRPIPRPEPVTVAETIIVGAWKERSDIDEATAGGLSVVEREEDLRQRRAFFGAPVGLPTCGIEGDQERSSDLTFSFPTFPRSATRVPAGPCARFRVDGNALRLSFVVEFAYRTWLPASVRAQPPAYDLVKLGDRGYLTLDLPLEAGAPEIPAFNPASGRAESQRVEARRD